MPKIKTHKGAAKRLRKTGTGKVVHRKTGQGHFNSRDSGNKTKSKRRDVSLHGTSSDIAARLIPYK